MLRVIRHRESCGQSRAVTTGVNAARHEWIATLDGDGQNDPADIPALLAKLSDLTQPENLELLAGWRNDTFLRRLSTKVANAVRSRMLKDNTPDTGCGLKVFARETFLQLPNFDHTVFCPRWSCVTAAPWCRFRSTIVRANAALKNTASITGCGWALSICSAWPGCSGGCVCQ